MFSSGQESFENGLHGCVSKLQSCSIKILERRRRHWVFMHINLLSLATWATVVWTQSGAATDMTLTLKYVPKIYAGQCDFVWIFVGKIEYNWSRHIVITQMS